MPHQMKVCSICKLPQDLFYKNKSRPDGLQSYCVGCSKDRSKERYKNFSTDQKDDIKKLAEEKRTRNKQFVWDYLKEHPCIDCGESDPIVLEFDHQSNKIDSICVMANSAVGLEKIQLEIDKCKVRCANCHRKKTAKDFGWYKNIVMG